jgi:hypothetical protein
VGGEKYLEQQSASREWVLGFVAVLEEERSPYVTEEDLLEVCIRNEKEAGRREEYKIEKVEALVEGHSLRSWASCLKYLLTVQRRLVVNC